MGKINAPQSVSFRKRKNGDLISRIEKRIFRTFLFFLWLVLPIMGIGTFVLGIIGLFYYLTEQTVPGLLVGLFFIPAGGFFIGWSFSLLAPLLGYYVFKIDLRYAGKRKKYEVAQCFHASRTACRYRHHRHPRGRTDGELLRRDRDRKVR